MMVFDDIVISFAISIAANAATNVISSIRSDKTLEDKINACFRKALKKWDMPQETRDNMRFSSIKFYTDLEEYLKNPAQGIHPKIKELLDLWVGEMKNDAVCYQFILSCKQEVQGQKIDSILSALNEEMSPKIDNVKEMLQQVLGEVQKLNTGTDPALDAKIEGILNGAVASFIEALKLESARKVIRELETQFSKAIDNSTLLKALVSYRKSQTLMYTDSKTAFELAHTAYKLEPENKEYVRIEVLRQTLKKDYATARRLVDKLSGEPKYSHLVEVLNAKDRKTAYETIPDELKNDYEFSSLLLERVTSDHPSDIGYLFHGEDIFTPSTFTYTTLKAWIFAATKARTKNQDFLALSFEAPQIKGVLQYLKVIEEFYNKLSATEVRDSFPIVKGIYCYWKFLTTRDSYWLDEFQKIDKKAYGEQRSYFEMIESSMLVLAKRFEEAFAVVVGINVTPHSTFIQYVVMMSFISGSTLQLQWILNKVKASGIKLDSNVSVYIAHSIEKDNAQETKNIIADKDFEKTTDKELLIQLCNYYSGKDVDVSTFKDKVEELDDKLKAYAANLLAENGDNQLAFDMLQPIVDENVPDFKQNVYLSVLDGMAEKKPNLYHILTKNRKLGNYCSDNLLSREFNLATKISDYQNALETITLLYERHPEDVQTFANYLITLGHIHPEKLAEYEGKATKIHIEETSSAAVIYRTFAENAYLKTAAEVLYRAAKSSEDLSLRTYYHNEAITGLIRPIAHEEKEVSGEGDFVLCDNNGDRIIYKATEFGSEIGKTLLGVRKDDVIETEISFIPVTLTIVGIYNKYYKLASDIMHEAQDGSNPRLRPFRIDMERPLESLEEILRKISGNEPTPEERKRKAYADYEEGKLALFNLIDYSNPLASYYKLLFTPFKIHANCSIVEYQQMPKPKDESVFILDIPSIITFAEFTAKTGMKIAGQMAVTTLQQDLVNTTRKAITKFLDADFYEAMSSGYLVKYNDYVDVDAQKHIEKLTEWIKDNCNVIVPDAALALDELKGDASTMLLLGSMAMLTKPEYYYVTDDIHIKSMMHSNQIIGTEIFVKYFNTEEVAKAYSRFLFECNFRGVDLDEEYILQEYEKTKHGEVNRMVAIMQNMNENPYLINKALTCCIRLANTEIYSNSLKLTFTNMFAMALKGFVPDYRYKLSQLFDDMLSLPFFSMQFAKICLHDAMLIANKGEIIIP